MCSRLAGRLLTSPFAFLVAGLIDFGLFAGAMIRRSTGSWVRRLRTSLGWGRRAS